ncbi:5540_t:CDS:2, partial [Racocetra persica]
EDTLQKCLNHYNKGPIYYRQDFAYKDDIFVQFNAQVVHFSVAFVYPVNALDVQSTIKCSAKLNFTVIAKSGGHSLEGYSIGDRDCILIVDLRYMNKLIIDVATQTAIVKTGNVLDTLFHSLNEHVFAFPTGECTTTGVGSIILGGITNRTIVNHAKEYPDLFWALRGAENAGYSIVTTLTLKIYPILKIVTSINVTYDFDQTQLVYSVMNKLDNSFHPNLTLMFDHQNGSLNEIKPHIQKFMKLTKPKKESYVEWDWYHANIVDTAWKMFNHYKTTVFFIDSPGLSYEDIEYLMEFMRNFKYVFFVRTMLIGGRKVNEIERNEMAFVHRNSIYMM